MKHQQIDKNTYWAIMPEYLPRARRSVEIMGISSYARDITPATVNNNIAVIMIDGEISPYDVGVDKISAALDSLSEQDNIKTIILDVNSPGGIISGVPELSDKIYEMRQDKRIIAVVNSLMASAAYWIGSAAETIYITPSGEAGSIGVYSIHFDYSALLEKEGIKATIIKAGDYKAEGNPYSPLSDEARNFIQNRIDDYYKMFIDSVARNRGISTGEVLANFGQGRTLLAKHAVDIKMVDEIATLNDVVNNEMKLNGNSYFDKNKMRMIHIKARRINMAR